MNSEQWTWLLSEGRFAYAAARLNGVGGARIPQLFLVSTERPTPDVWPIAPSLDRFFLSKQELIGAGATGRGQKMMVRQSLVAPTTPVELSYGRPWSLDQPGVDDPAHAALHSLEGRVVLLMPTRKSLNESALTVLEISEGGSPTSV